MTNGSTRTFRALMSSQSTLNAFRYRPKKLVIGPTLVFAAPPSPFIVLSSAAFLGSGDEVLTLGTPNRDR